MKDVLPSLSSLSVGVSPPESIGRLFIAGILPALSPNAQIDRWVGLSALEEIIKREPDVFGDLTEQDRGDVPTLMKRNRCAVPRSIAELFVRSALANFGETKLDEDSNDFIGLEDGSLAHDSSNSDVLNSDKLGFQYGFTIFQKHCNNLVKVVINFIQRCSLGMGAGETRNKANE